MEVRQINRPAIELRMSGREVIELLQFAYDNGFFNYTKTGSYIERITNDADLISDTHVPGGSFLRVLW